MYSPTTRLLTVLEMLQSHKHISGPELARRLEIDVRTVRRYIVNLQDMGIPVEAERGPYGAYQLQRGYKLPPLMFTDSEAVAMSLGLLVIREFRFPVEAAAVEGALAKTERVMPEALLTQVRSLQEAISFNIGAPPIHIHSRFLTTLSLAVQQHQQVLLRYQSYQGADSERAFDPYGIVFNEGYWYTAGYCHLRSDIRTFRLDRVTELALLEEPFERPAEFDPLTYVMHSLGAVQGDDDLEVLLKTTMERAQELFSPMMGTLEESNEGIIFRRSATQLVWIAHVLLHADFPVVIRQNDKLRQQIRLMASRALEMVGDW